MHLLNGPDLGVQSNLTYLLTSADGCGKDDQVCSWVASVTGSKTAADVTAFFMENVASILLTILVAFVSMHLLKRLIGHGMERISKGAIALRGDQLAKLDGRDKIREEQRQLRVEKRTETLSGVLIAVARTVVWGLAAIIILGELGINLAPLIAGAGIAGVAVGFGAQKVVGDFLSGMFMIAEDQFGVGDIIDLGDATGTVERVTLRTTVLRDMYGTVWHVPNGQVQRVGNMSQEWSTALLDVGVDYGADIDRASSVLLHTANDLAHDPDFSDAFLDDPEVLGVQTLAPDAVTIRISVRTRPAEQFRVQRELNRRFKQALDAAGIDIPFPQRTIWIHDGSEATARTEGNSSGETDDVAGAP